MTWCSIIVSAVTIQAAELDLSDGTHLLFIRATANLFAYSLGLRPDGIAESESKEDAAVPLVPMDHSWRNADFIASSLAKAPTPKYNPRNAGVEVNEDGTVNVS